MMAKDRKSGRTGAGKLYHDDLYSDFDLAVHELDEDLSSTPALAEAVRTSQMGRRPPSTSAASRLVSTRRATPRPPPGFFDAQRHSGPPPLTAIHRAGYSSAGSLVSIPSAYFRPISVSTVRPSGSKAKYNTFCSLWNHTFALLKKLVLEATVTILAKVHSRCDARLYFFLFELRESLESLGTEAVEVSTLTGS